MLLAWFAAAAWAAWIGLTILCFAHPQLFFERTARTGPMPSISRSRSGVASMTSNPGNAAC